MAIATLADLYDNPKVRVCRGSMDASLSNLPT